MARGDVVAAGISRRIDNSPLSLTINYPPARPVITGSSPAPMSASPLTGPAEVLEALATDAVPSKPPVEITCLWTDAFARTIQGSLRAERTNFATVWMDGAEALAQVKVSDAVMDVTDPYGDTKFTDAAYVEFKGHRYEVMSVQAPTASFRDPSVYYVWLSGSTRG